MKSGTLTLVLLCICLISGPAALADEWQWELTPYIWASDTTLDATVNETGIGGTVDFSELVDKLDIAGLIHFEGHRGRAGFFVEANYYEFSDDKTILSLPPITDGSVVNSQLDMLIGEAGGFYRFQSEKEHLDLLFGVRVFDMGLDLDLDFPVLADRTISRDETMLDGFIGARILADLSPRWSWWARVDAGTGDTELSWQATMGLGVRLGKSGKNTLMMAYRHLTFEFEDGSSGITGVELELSGALVGFRFGF